MTAVAGRFTTEFHDPANLVDDVKFAPSSTVTPASSLCVGCGAAIHDAFILHVQPDLEWHGRCLNCSKCHRSLGNDPTCFVRDGKAYCREDYFK
ncbi:hypothetical protein P879_05592 [Paragonimus westermani]|uniref:LIM zinc-binding domain-containing protein n=1 Tax=Paragonimus westermani TaxID=34504 RepID=A0A8T0DKG7_9TREM|nr:hypothetical protein P879_05592 [Paragonimus westermani]